MTLRTGAAGTRIAAWLAVMLSLVMSVVANAASRDDYARQWPLTLGQEESGAYRVLLDEAVYRSASEASLADVEVFNAQGQPLPAALLSPAQPLAQAPRTLALPWFPLPALDPADGGGDLRQVGGVAVTHRRAHLAELDPVRRRGERRHQGPRLVGGLAARDRGGVEVVVHPQRVPDVSAVDIGGEIAHHPPVVTWFDSDEVESPALRDEHAEAHRVSFDRDDWPTQL